MRPCTPEPFPFYLHFFLGVFRDKPWKDFTSTLTLRPFYSQEPQLERVSQGRVDGWLDVGVCPVFIFWLFECTDTLWWTFTFFLCRHSFIVPNSNLTSILKRSP